MAKDFELEDWIRAHAQTKRPSEIFVIDSANGKPKLWKTVVRNTQVSSLRRPPDTHNLNSAHSHDDAIAFDLLHQPQETPVPEVQKTRQVAAALTRLARELEIIGPGEWALDFTVSFQDTVDKLRSLRTALEDAPPLADSLRFPSAKVVEQLLAFSGKYRKHLEARLSLAGGQDRENNEAALKEMKHLIDIYENVLAVAIENAVAANRRMALARLKEKIGENLYVQGKLPPPVPLWRFKPIA
jgi:hypothetical protein